MRLGVTLSATADRPSLACLIRQARVAEELGIELGWIGATAGGPLALPVAAALAPQTSALRFAAEVLADAHPVTIAEEAAVADQLSNGRLVLVVRHDTDAARLGETADVLLAAAASRPFRHEGPGWTTPARLPANEDHEARLIVTPAPAQLEMPLWLSGAAAADPARRRGLTHVVVAHGEAAAADWGRTDTELRGAAARLRRPALFDVASAPDGDFDDGALIAELLRERDTWSLDVAILRFAQALDDAAWVRALTRVAAMVRPSVQLDQVPGHLTDHWAAVMPAALPAIATAAGDGASFERIGG